MARRSVRATDSPRAKLRGLHSSRVRVRLMKSDDSERALTPVGPRRDSRGRYLIGHGAPGPGRPPGVVNALSRTLREQVLDGFAQDGGVEAFVANLLHESPAAAAALLAKMLPPEPTDAD